MANLPVSSKHISLCPRKQGSTSVERFLKFVCMAGNSEMFAAETKCLCVHNSVPSFVGPVALSFLTSLLVLGVSRVSGSV